MGLQRHSSNFQDCIKKTNKIPDYASDYRNEWLYIRGISKEFKYFVENINEATRGLFQNHKVDRVKKFIKDFLLAQERGRLQDTSNFEISSNDLCYIVPYPGLKNIYDDFELFCSKFKIKYEDGGSFWDYYSDSDSESESESNDLVIL